ncbi:MAG: phospholipase [Micavibrio aeruginosavorus]|uniref:Phospholipase n=1 Tax=Micavibrio aeruginosavorus TaxID=349221 RepID=A0A2W5PZA5_9BACT|nr:MAG: phospholipase [Micavibrio aeruginosavorus]
MSLKTYVHSPKSGKKPESMVILLHGLGANGQDLLGLAQFWQRLLPDTVFLSPDAPFPCDMAPVGFQWFSLQDWSPASILEGVQTAAPILDAYIDEMLEKYGLSDDKLALVGFSQGTMMSLYAGPRRKKKIAGVLGYSGALIGAETLGESAVHKIPVHLVHGDFDMVVPITAYYMALESLESHGFTVSGGVTAGLGHGIDDEGIESGGEFLSKVLS